jgi:hypothetical protein
MVGLAKIFLEKLRKYSLTFNKVKDLYENVKYVMYFHTIRDIDENLVCVSHEGSLMMRVWCFPSGNCSVEFKYLYGGNDWRDVLFFDVKSKGEVVVWFYSEPHFGVHADSPADLVSKILERHRDLVMECIAAIEERAMKATEAEKTLTAIKAMFKMMFG